MIRIARQADADAMLEIYRPFVEHTAVSFETEVPTTAAFAARIGELTASLPWLVCQVADGSLAGYAYACGHRQRKAYRWTVEVSVYVAQSYRAHGVAKGLYSAVLSLLAAQGYATALAGITLPNPDSVGLHERLGFEHVGTYRTVGYKLGRWHDVGWWQYRFGAAAAQPGEPRPIGEFLDSTRWVTAIADAESMLDDSLRAPMEPSD